MSDAPSAIGGDWAAALLDPALACPPGVRAWNGSDPAARLAVHRNNVVSSLVDGLASTFPVVQALVGEAFFRAMAAVFVRASPPRSPVLAGYGDAMPGFIASFAPARGLAYLADVARLEFARVRAFHAADVAPLTAAAAPAALAHGERVGELRLVCHPAWQLVCSPHPIASLWAAHQSEVDDVPLAAIDLGQAESALVLRPALEVHVLALAPGAAAFADALGRQTGLAEAAAAAVAADSDFDLSATLGLLLAQWALTGLTLP